MNRVWVDLHLTGWNVVIYTVVWMTTTFLHAFVKESLQLRRARKAPRKPPDGPGGVQQAPGPETGGEGAQ